MNARAAWNSAPQHRAGQPQSPVPAVLAYAAQCSRPVLVRDGEAGRLERVVVPSLRLEGC
jgi:hypothetical protein